MATIATMTDDSAESGSADPQPPGPRASVPHAGIAAPEQRSMHSAVLATIIAALIVGVFSFAVVGFNVLRNDIGSIRNDMEAGFAQVDERFARIETVLVDHTDRLARVEAVHGAHTHTPEQP